jgi:hypothetical protein
MAGTNLLHRLGLHCRSANDSPSPLEAEMTRAYVTAGRVAELERSLSNRELAIVATLDRVRLATSEQLLRLHGGSGTRRSVIRGMQRTLTRLLSLRVVARLDRTVGGVRAGSSGHVYALDAAGQRIASGSGPAGGRRLRRPWTPGVVFVAHQLAVTELYVLLREAEGAGPFELLDFWAEPLCWRTFTGLGGARVVLKPDAFVRVGLGEVEDLYFLEVDRATHSLPAIERKSAIYRRYFQTGREQERWNVFPKVLFLVPTEARKEALVDTLGRQPAADWGLFQVAHQDDALDLIAREEAS